jgi:hypothetical protein
VLAKKIATSMRTSHMLLVIVLDLPIVGTGTVTLPIIVASKGSGLELLSGVLRDSTSGDVDNWPAA